jgi:hypothetical protein
LHGCLLDVSPIDTFSKFYKCKTGAKKLTTREAVTIDIHSSCSLHLRLTICVASWEVKTRKKVRHSQSKGASWPIDSVIHNVANSWPITITSLILMTYYTIVPFIQVISLKCCHGLLTAEFWRAGITVEENSYLLSRRKCDCIAYCTAYYIRARDLDNAERG